MENKLEWGNLRQVFTIGFIDINDEIVVIEWEVFNKRSLSRHLGRKFEYPWAVNNSNLQPEDVVLDAGSGMSLFQFYLAKHCRKVVSYNHPGMVPEFKEFTDMAKQKGIVIGGFTNVDFVGGDLKQISYPDNYFDKVYCISVIEHAKDDERPVLIKELFRVLKPGGILILTIDAHVTLDQKDGIDIIIGPESTALPRQCEPYCGKVPPINTHPDLLSLPFLFEDRGKKCIIVCMRLIKKGV